MGAALFQVFPWAGLLLLVLLVRWSKGVAFADAYALISRPFWPGTAQSEWLRSAQRLDTDLRLGQLAQDNTRLRGLLELDQSRGSAIPAAVISREVDGWWQQILLTKGSLEGVHAGDAVEGPGGLLGLVSQVSLSTATVTLLTDPASRIGVWVPRTRQHGLLNGVGTSRPVLRFVDKDPQVLPGDVVLTSPASTLVPANLPVGVVQSLDPRANPAPEAIVQLSAPVDAIDWVEVRPRSSR
ncbi:MAG: rod shape-determining protein MreC [Cyanobacteriota bacterium]